MEVKLLSQIPDEPHYVAKFLESIGRISHASSSGDLDKTKKFIKTLIKLGHLSVLEHFSLSFEISGISRACATQLLRHRHCAFTQESMRYVKLDPKYVIPDTVANLENKKAYEAYKQLLNTLTAMYKVAITKLKIPKEDARYFLPLATTTKIIISTNIREWLHIINVRVSKSAQWEIRELVSLIWKILYSIEPFIFDIDVIALLPDVNDLETKREIFSSWNT